MAADILGGVRGLRGERLHLAGHHGEPFARPRRLDCRIQRQQVGPAGDFADQVGNGTDPCGLRVQRLDRGAGLMAGGHGAAGHRGGPAHLVADFADCGGEVIGGIRHGLRCSQGLRGGGRGAFGRASGPCSGTVHLRRRLGHGGGPRMNLRQRRPWFSLDAVSHGDQRHLGLLPPVRVTRLLGQAHCRDHASLKDHHRRPWHRVHRAGIVPGPRPQGRPRPIVASRQ